MKTVSSFLFYSFYLLAAELPLLFVLLLRSVNNTEVYNILKVILLFSILTNLLIFILLILWPTSIFKEPINDNFKVLSNNSISEFFSFFLLPFFTFSLNSSSEARIVFAELAILFFLLNIFLFRTKSLTSNVLIYLFFNIYSSNTKGKEFTLLTFTPLTFDDLTSNSNVIKINRNFYIYYGDKKKTFKVSLSIIVVVLMVLFYLILRYL